MPSYLWIVLGVATILFFWIVGVFNSFIRKRNRVHNAWSDIDVQLKRRYDLVPNLVETVKGYKGYESSILEDVAKARASALSAQGGDITNRARAEGMLSNTLRTLFAVAENYPELKSAESFRKLQEQLSILENDIQSAREYYNASVREFNNAIQIFPAHIIASVFSFKKFEFFSVNENEKGPTSVSF
ncbi:MAG: hypothetical protein RIQ54_646 [Candidatus Parcubacteria bacterium]|jgi:LemA protein